MSRKLSRNAQPAIDKQAVIDQLDLFFSLPYKETSAEKQVIWLKPNGEPLVVSDDDKLSWPARYIYNGVMWTGHGPMPHIFNCYSELFNSREDCLAEIERLMLKSGYQRAKP